MHKKKNTVYFVTSNTGKANTAKRLLSKYSIKLKHIRIDLPEPRSFDLREIAHAKANFAYSKFHKPCIVQDSGFYVKSLNGFPRTFVHFSIDTIGINGILKLTEGKERSCSFKSCLTYCEGSKIKKDFITITKGALSYEPKGMPKRYHWSALFQIFVPEGSKKTLAEMSKKEYEEWYDTINKGSEMLKFGKWYSKKM
jgi:XTP/dITP diphosphohydrolase